MSEILDKIQTPSKKEPTLNEAPAEEVTRKESLQMQKALDTKTNEDAGTGESDFIARQSNAMVSNKSSVYSEYNGFFIDVLSTSTLICFILWSLVPTSVYEEYFDFDYVPDKYWAVAIPSYSLMLMLYVYIALALYNTEVKTLKLNDLRNFIDEFSVVPGRNMGVEEANEEMVKYVHSSPSGVWDLPISLVNEVLYGEEEEEEEEEEHEETRQEEAREEKETDYKDERNEAREHHSTNDN